MSDKPWKKFERDVAKLFNTRRTPLSGINSAHTGSDTLHHRLYIECKLRKNSAVHTLYDKTAIAAKAEDKIPVLALKQKNKPILLVVNPYDLPMVADYYKYEGTDYET